jgi:putative AlgH/UPF0301 family transcriptional regulator
MARGAWLHTSVDPGLVFETPADEIWDTRCARSASTRATCSRVAA